MGGVPFLVGEIVVGVGCVEEGVVEFIGFVVDGGGELVVVVVAVVFVVKVYVVFLVLFLARLCQGFLIADQWLVRLGRFAFGVEAETRFALFVAHTIIQIEFITVCHY
jgi:hypothetical protein